MDTFFCSDALSDFSAAFPTAGTADVFFLRGENKWAKQALFSALLKTAAAYKIPHIRVFQKHSVGKTAAVYLPAQHRFAVDADYFSCLCVKYPHAKYCTVPPYIEMSPAAETAQKALLAQDAQAAARAAAFLQAAARAKEENAKALRAYADRTRILRAVMEVLQNLAPPVQKTRGKILYRRQISTVTALGVHTLYNPFLRKGIRTAVLRDAYGGVAPIFLQGLAAACTEIGYDIEVYTELTKLPVHLVLPQCNIAFFTENDLHPFPFRVCGVLGASRFLDRTAARRILPALQRGQTAATDALEHAVFSLYERAEIDRTVLRFAEKNTDCAALKQAETSLLSDFFDFRRFAERDL